MSPRDTAGPALIARPPPPPRRWGAPRPGASVLGLRRRARRRPRLGRGRNRLEQFSCDGPPRGQEGRRRPP
eukprot:8268305-Pyramimonas_sp.AAC.1